MGTLQARILEWVAIPFSRGSSLLRVEPGSPALQVNSLPSELTNLELYPQNEGKMREVVMAKTFPKLMSDNQTTNVGNSENVNQ